MIRFLRCLFLIPLVVIFNGCIHLYTGPGYNEIALLSQPLTKRISGSIDFVGLEVFQGGNPENVTKYPGNNRLFSQMYVFGNFKIMEKTLLQFIAVLSASQQKRIHNFTAGGNLLVHGETRYTQTMFYEHPPVYDYIWTDGLPKEPLKMNSWCLSYLKRNSTADYFLVVAVKPLKVEESADKKNLFLKIVLITVLYSNSGERVYSKIYEEQSDEVPKTDQKNGFYNCTLKLLKNNASQIKSDLAFINDLEEAKSPTLVDLSFRLNNSN